MIDGATRFAPTNPASSHYDGAMPDKRSTETDFRFSERSDGRVEITRGGRFVTVLTGVDAARFMRRVASSDDEAQQRLMAKVTGKYKFGNERTARQHPRNR